MPRAVSRRAIEIGKLISRASRCTCCESALRRAQRTSAFVVLINIVDRHASEIFHQVQQVLVSLVPLGGNLVEEHDALVRPAQLDKAGLANVIAQPAYLFHIFVAGISGVLQALHEVVEFVALEYFLVYGEKCRARFLGQLDEVFPAFRIVARVPHHRMDVFGYVTLKPAQSVAEDEGGHVVFEAGKVLWHSKISRAAGWKIRRGETHHTPISDDRVADVSPA